MADLVFRSWRTLIGCWEVREKRIALPALSMYGKVFGFCFFAQTSLLRRPVCTKTSGKYFPVQTYNQGQKSLTQSPKLRLFSFLTTFCPPTPSYNVGIVLELCQIMFSTLFWGWGGGRRKRSGKNVFFSTKVEQLIKKTYLFWNVSMVLSLIVALG